MLTPILRLLATYLVVGLVVFGFFNRDRIAGMMGWGGEEEPAEVAEQAPAAPAPEPQPVAQPAADSAAPVFAPPPGENGVPEAGAAPAPAPSAPTSAAPSLQTPTPPAGASTASTQQAPTPPANGLQRPTPPAGASTAATSPAPAVQTPTPPANGLQTPAPPAGASTAALARPTPPASPQQASPQADSFTARLEAARAAYWQGDIAAAIAKYTDLLEEYPESESLHGELGNIHYMNGNRVEAATHYEAAALAALEAGHRQQAEMLAGVLSTLDLGAADRVQKALEANP